MSLIRWHRPHGMLSVVDEMDRTFRDVARMPWALLQGTEFEWGPAVDVYEQDDHVVVKAGVPGAKKEDLEVSASDEGVTIHGETKQEEEVKEEGYYRKEIRHGVFHRMVPWPVEVDPDSVAAKMEDGMLVITAQKSSKATGGKKVEVS